MGLRSFLSDQEFSSAAFRDELDRTAQRTLLILYAIGLMAYGVYLFLDASIGLYLNLMLRVGILAFMISGFVIIVRRADSPRTRYFLNIAMVLSTLLEIELEHRAPDAVYSDAKNWLTVLFIMLMSSFGFQGTPRTYVISWIPVLLYFVLRPLVSHPVDLVYALVCLGGVTGYIGCCYVNRISYRSRYRFLVVKGQMRDEQTRRQKLEHEQGLVLERELAFLDFHDHAGAAFTDLKLAVDRIGDAGLVEPAALANINEKLMILQKALRDRLYHRSDLAETLKNPETGLHLALLRRYADAGRQLRFEWKGPTDLPVNSWTLEQVFSLVVELATNDLKYGSGISRWNISASPETLRITVPPVAEGASPKHGTQLALESVRKRIQFLGAEYDLGEHGLDIRIPLIGALQRE